MYDGSLKSSDTFWVTDSLWDAGWRPKTDFVLLSLSKKHFQKHKIGGSEAASDLTQGLTSLAVCEARIQY